MIEESQEVVFASYLIRFCPIHERHTRLLQYWLRSDGYWKLVSERGAGTTRASLNAKVLSEFPLVVPSVSVADAFEGQIASLRARVIVNASESRTLTALRDTLLPKLVAGELRMAHKFYGPLHMRIFIVSEGKKCHLKLTLESRRLVTLIHLAVPVNMSMLCTVNSPRLRMGDTSFNGSKEPLVIFCNGYRLRSSHRK